MPALSVVIPTRDRARRLARAVRSVLDQTVHDLEVIVVDDGSTDDTATVIERLEAEDRRLRHIRVESPGGAGAARNRGIDEATGVVLAFLDDDDVWHPGKAGSQLALLDHRVDVVAVSCHHEILTPGGRVVPHRGPRDVSAGDLLWDNFLGSTSFLAWRRDRFPVEPRFDPQLDSAQDWDVWLQCAAAGPVAVVPEVLCRYDASHPARITASVTARRAGRATVVARHRPAMAPSCVRYHEVRAAIDGASGLPGELAVATRAAGHDLALVWLLVSCALAGRAGWLDNDAGRGPRRLHRLVRGIAG